MENESVSRTVERTNYPLDPLGRPTRIPMSLLRFRSSAMSAASMAEALGFDKTYVARMQRVADLCIEAHDLGICGDHAPAFLLSSKEMEFFESVDRVIAPEWRL